MSEIDKSKLATQATADVAKADKVKSVKHDKGDDKKTKKPSFFKRITKWLKEMKSELKKVQWPTWRQTLKSTGIVIICVIIVGIFIAVFDTLAQAVVGALISLFNG